MRLEHGIRRWLGLVAHRVKRVEEADERLVAEIEAIEGRLLRCGCCGRQVRRSKGRTRRRLRRDLKIRHLPLVIAYTPRRVVCPDCGVRVEKVPWADRWSRVTESLSRVVAQLARMIRKHLEGIPAWTKLRISNGALEGMNNKVKLVSHRSYGFRNDDRYIKAIYHNCGDLPLPSEE